MSATPRRKKRTRAKTGAGSTALSRPVKVDGAFAALLGKDELPRTEITKLLWVYIRKHNLQNETKKIQIDAYKDAPFRALFPKDSFTMFEMMKFIQPHIIQPAKK